MRRQLQYAGNSVEIWRKSYLSIFVGEINAERAHGANDSDQRLDGVAVDDRLELFVVLACEATLMDDSIIIITTTIIIILNIYCTAALEAINKTISNSIRIQTLFNIKFLPVAYY